MKVDEKLRGFYALEQFDGKTVSKAILDVFLHLGIGINLCRGMTFDGASAFSSNSVYKPGFASIQTQLSSHTSTCIVSI